MFIELTLLEQGSKVTLNATRIREVYTVKKVGEPLVVHGADVVKPMQQMREITEIQMIGDDEGFMVEETYREVQELMSLALEQEVPVKRGRIDPVQQLIHANVVISALRMFLNGEPIAGNPLQMLNRQLEAYDCIVNEANAVRRMSSEDVFEPLNKAKDEIDEHLDQLFNNGGRD